MQLPSHQRHHHRSITEAKPAAHKVQLGPLPRATHARQLGIPVSMPHASYLIPVTLTPLYHAQSSSPHSSLSNCSNDVIEASGFADKITFQNNNKFATHSESIFGSTQTSLESSYQSLVRTTIHSAARPCHISITNLAVTNREFLLPPHSPISPTTACAAQIRLQHHGLITLFSTLQNPHVSVMLEAGDSVIRKSTE